MAEDTQNKPLDRTKAFVAELYDQIYHGALVERKNGLQKLFAAFGKKVSKNDAPVDFLASEEKFEKKVQEIVWSKEVLASLEGIVKFNMPLDKFHQNYAYIPLEMVEKKAKWLSGVTHVAHTVQFTHGIGRIGTDEELRIAEAVIPEASYSAPYDSGITDADWSVRVLNGANIGINYSKLIHGNPVRCALADARRRGHNAVILANTIELDYVAGGSANQVYRAAISGLKTNVEILDPDYQAKARRILKDLPTDEMIYETAAEQFTSIISGWTKICIQPDGTPEFPGPMFHIWGYKESRLVAKATAFVMRYFTLLTQKKLDVEISAVQHSLKEAKQFRSGTRKIEKRLAALVSEKARTRVGNIRPADRIRYRNRMRAIFIKKFEEAIPNCKVVSVGKNAYFKFGKSVVKFVKPSHIRVSDALLANEANHYGPAVLKGCFPDALVVCHPHSLNTRWTKREADAKGKRGSAPIFVAPIAIEDDFLRKSIEDEIYVSHHLAAAINNGQFRAGVLDLNCLHGIISHDDVSMGALIASEARKPAAVKGKSIPDEGFDWRSKYIWTIHPTDQHWGSQSKEFVKDKEHNRQLGMCEAVIEMMRRKGLCEGNRLPVHMLVSNDDFVQGNHFQGQRQTHPLRMPYVRIEEEVIKLLASARDGNSDHRLSVFQQTAEFLLNQFQVRGESWTQDQVEQVFARHIEPNVDFYSALLTRATGAGLILKGGSAYQDGIVKFDSRDVGFINYGTGNHIERTVMGEISEGRLYAQGLRYLLRTRPEWNDKKDLLEKLVCAPLEGGQFMGWGSVQAPGGYEWGLEFRDEPPVLSSWGDTLQGAVRNDERRGNYSRIAEGKVTLKSYGDKHFGAYVATSHTIYVMGLPGTCTDRYGHHGFPPNNTGVLFVGLPVDGPDGGPVLVRALSFDCIKSYFDKPYDFKWEEFLPNPA